MHDSPPRSKNQTWDQATNPPVLTTVGDEDEAADRLLDGRLSVTELPDGDVTAGERARGALDQAAGVAEAALVTAREQYEVEDGCRLAPGSRHDLEVGGLGGEELGQSSGLLEVLEGEGEAG